MLELLRRHRVLLSAGGLLVLALLNLSISVRSDPYRDPVGELVLEVLAPLLGAVSAIQGGTREIWVGYLALVGAQRQNDLLRERITSLETSLVRLRELERENARLGELLQFRARVAGRAIGARVVGRDPLLWFRSFAIDVGSRDGVRQGMAVLAPQGAVGRVTEVGPNASRVMLLTDHSSGIDAVIQRSRARGIVRGAHDTGCRMSYLRRDVDVAVGDHVVSSGLDGSFPKGVSIGEVVDLALEHDGLLQSAVIRPSVKLDGLEEVMVVEAGAQMGLGTD